MKTALELLMPALKKDFGIAAVGHGPDAVLQAMEEYASQFKQQNGEIYKGILKSILDEALSFGYHAAKDELKGIPSNGYADKFYEKFK
jgi:hypothetical protein